VLEDAEPLASDRAALLAATTALESTRRKLAEADEELRAWLAENPNCPYCGSRIATDGEGLAHVHA
jgi:hypothetical protein